MLCCSEAARKAKALRVAGGTFAREPCRKIGYSQRVQIAHPLRPRVRASNSLVDNVSISWSLTQGWIHYDNGRVLVCVVCIMHYSFFDPCRSGRSLCSGASGCATSGWICAVRFSSGRKWTDCFLALVFGEVWPCFVLISTVKTHCTVGLGRAMPSALIAQLLWYIVFPFSGPISK